MTSNRRRLGIALGVTVTILLVEAVGAWLSGSLALLADAGHMLTDSAGLAIALIAASLAARPATPQRTWGYRRAEVLAATLQAAILLAVGVFIIVEGIRRLLQPPEVASTAMIVFGVVGLLGNAASILVLTGGQKGQNSNLNMRAALLEVINDALGSVAVLIAAVVIATTGWLRADALVSLLIGALILPRTIKLLRETIEVLLEATPRGLDLDAVRRHLLELPHVRDVHDLHASQITSGLPVLSAHVVVDDGCFHDGHTPQMLDALQACVAEHFEVAIEHSTFQLEPAAHAAHEAGAHH
ncbi:cation diffusion facilitator family transporter [Kineococcus radiotolerans]|uniref:cation diffusion facilitator family transporter n=1 Tax=Kineococcus radiotolerans TaxID=131568 RepID=UPI00059C2315|nr:cation diffusion facilitator family transporter [Kineococcus radiotolerans]